MFKYDNSWKNVDDIDYMGDILAIVFLVVFLALFYMFGAVLQFI